MHDFTTDAASTPDLPIVVGPEGTTPQRAHAHDAGLDLSSAETHEIPPGGRALVGTGVRMALPSGTVGLVCPRSGLATKHGVTVLNGPGVVDAGYRGEVKVALLNTDPDHTVRIAPGDRIAQLVVLPFLAPVPTPVEDLDDTDRAHRGFGSSGGLSTTGKE